MKKKNLCKSIAGILACSLVMAGTMPAVSTYAYGEEVDVSTSTFKQDTDDSADYQSWLADTWSTEKADSGKIALTPGRTENDLNFAWYSMTTGIPAVRIWVAGADATADATSDAVLVVRGTATPINQENWQGNVYTASNKVSIEGYFTENTDYQYQYTDNYNGAATVWSEVENYSTHSFSQFTVILTGDPQVGASGSSSDYSANDTSASRDTYNWNKTIESAMKVAPDAAFLLSAGDQIDKSGATKANDIKTRESEYAGYLYPDAFRSLPIAATIGNHDTNGIDYTYHFNNPNANTGLGSTPAGSDYYFSYGDVLFISLNSNNRNQEEHRELLSQAVESNPDAAWKVVIFHSDIYGSGQPHADTDAASNRIIFAPLMDEFDIDLCLTGHDHTYSRSYQIYNGNVIDYDISNGSVLNPEGTLYITTGSGSGSKYYNLLNYTPYYIAERTNVCLPAYSTIKFTNGSLTISTYDYEGNQYADTFTIYKDSTEVTLEDLEAQVAQIDASRYTEESVAAVKAALANLQALYEISEDAGAQMASANYNTSEDPLSGYGSVKEAYKDTLTDGSKVNRLMRGFSTLIDKTIYLQMDGQTLPIVAESAYTEAKTAVLTSLAKLELKADDSNNGDNNNENNNVDNGNADAGDDDDDDDVYAPQEEFNAAVTAEIKSQDTKVIEKTVTTEGAIEPDVFAALKETGKTFEVKVQTTGGEVLAVISINGKEITKTNVKFDLGISVDNTQGTIQSLLEKMNLSDKASVQLDFDFAGELPGPTNISVNVARRFDNGAKITLFYYNPETGVLENQNQTAVVENGYVQFTFTHCSQYVLVETDAAAVETVTADTASPKTGDNSNTMFYILLGVMASVAGVAAITGKKEENC